MVVPGFIDSHVHFLERRIRLVVGAAARREDAGGVRRAHQGVSRATLPAGAWITDGDWDHEQWGGELPRRDWIDAVTPNNPVWINRLDGHMALANSAALRAAGVTRDTPDVDGGTIVRDATASRRASSRTTPSRSSIAPCRRHRPEAQDRALDAAMRYVASNGVTSVHHMGTWDDLAVFERAHAAGALTTRIYAAVPLAHVGAAARHGRRARGRGDAWLRIGALKGFVDGSLGSHTAAMLEPFTDAPDDAGLFVNTPDDLYAWTSGADKAGLHMIVHAIGDRAIRTQLDIYRARRARERRARSAVPHRARAAHRSRRHAARSRSSASSRACSRITRSTTGAGRRR